MTIPLHSTQSPDQDQSAAFSLSRRYCWNESDAIKLNVDSARVVRALPTPLELFTVASRGILFGRIGFHHRIVNAESRHRSLPEQSASVFEHEPKVHSDLANMKPAR